MSSVIVCTHSRSKGFREALEFGKFQFYGKVRKFSFKSKDISLLGGYIFKTLHEGGQKKYVSGMADDNFEIFLEEGDIPL